MARKIFLAKSASGKLQKIEVEFAYVGDYHPELHYYYAQPEIDPIKLARRKMKDKKAQIFEKILDQEEMLQHQKEQEEAMNEYLAEFYSQAS